MDPDLLFSYGGSHASMQYDSISMWNLTVEI